jgi:hypothetical protein
LAEPLSRSILWKINLLTMSDFDSEMNYWSWDAALSKFSDATYHLVVTQSPGAPGDEDWDAAETSGPLSGDDLFSFLHGAWIEHTAETLGEKQWLAVASRIRRRDKTLAGQFSSAVQREFHPVPEPEHVPSALDLELQKCVQGATWSESGGGGAGGLGMVVFTKLRRQAAHMYAARFRDEHGVLPSGTHHVVAHVGPPGSGADFSHPMGQGTCSLSLDITFPS